MALILSSPRIFNENMVNQAYSSNTSSSAGSKCSCCPYGYHIDLDFVEYCEAIASGNIEKNTMERRKKRERRKQCQSMEILLGLVNPELLNLENESVQLSKINREIMPNNIHLHSTALDLSDVVDDFEATLKRFGKPKKNHDHINENKTDETSTTDSIQNITHMDLSTDCDAVSVGSGNSNHSAGTLQNIREQMAMSLERMKELEEQVKAIPMLQVQVSVLKEEKRNLQKQMENFTGMCTPVMKINLTNQRIRSQSYSMENTSKTINIPTRDIGIMCGVMTRDVGVSHQHVRTKDVGMVTSTPIQSPNKPTDTAILRINESDLDEKINFIPSSIHTTPTWYTRNFNDANTLLYSSKFSQSNKINNDFSLLKLNRKNSLIKSEIKVENIFPDAKEFRDFSTNTNEIQAKSLTKNECLTDNIHFESLKNCEIKETRTCGTETILSLHDIHTSNDVSQIVQDTIKIYHKSVEKNIKVSTKSTQCTLKMPVVPAKRNQETQVIEPFIMKLNVGITAKPKTADIGIDVRPSNGTKSIAVGPDPESIQTISLSSLNSLNSLNLLNSRSHSFNYGDVICKKKITKSVGSTVDGLIKTSTKKTDTIGLAPKLREFGTSPIRKKFVDVSVGDSLRPHIAISCAANYCDNCKETIKTLAKQMSNNSENNYKNPDMQSSNIVSRIPRPSHIPVNNSDLRRQLKRQDTYTKIPTGIIRYDADNKESYNENIKHQKLDGNNEIKDGKKESKKISSPDTEINIDEKASLSESALFEPIRDKSRVKQEPSKEMRAAMKVLDDNLKKSPCKNISHQTKNATNVIQLEWFKISSTATANPLDVEDYLDCFEEYSSYLLEFIVNMVDSSGNTAMHYAVSHGNFDVVSILLDSKVCDINKANAAGYTAVMLAALAEVRNSTHLSVANRLFQLADVNVRAKLHGQTALMLAVSHGRNDMTRLLLNAGAAVNIQDEDGSTALMCAAEHGHIDIVRSLLANTDCDSSIVDIDGSSALKIALEAGNRDIGVLIYAHEHVNRGSSPYSSIRRSRWSSKSSTPVAHSSSAPTSPAPSKRFNTTNSSLTTLKYSAN